MLQGGTEEKMGGKVSEGCMLEKTVCHRQERVNADKGAGSSEWSWQLRFEINPWSLGRMILGTWRQGVSGTAWRSA